MGCGELPVYQDVLVEDTIQFDSGHPVRMDDTVMYASRLIIKDKLHTEATSISPQYCAGVV